MKVTEKSKEELLQLKAELDEEYKDAEFIGCTGTLCGNKLVIDKINAFEFCFVNLTK